MKTKRSKRGLAALLAIVMLLSLMPITAFAGSPADVDDNVWVQVPYLTDKSKFSGTGTQGDPYYAESFYNRESLDEIEITTVNPQAKINGEESALAVPLSYGYNDINFSVTSADETLTAYYWVKWQRLKGTRPVGRIPNGALSSTPAISEQSTGTIQGLDANEYYDYKANGAAEWISVHGVTEITGLSAGTYRVKYGESESMKASGDSDAVSVPVGISTEQMPIQNNTDFVFAELAQSAAAGQRIQLKLALQKNEWVKNIEVKCVTTPPSGFGSSFKVTFYFDSYTTEDGTKYYNTHFIMPVSHSQYTAIKIESVSVSTEKYYSIEQPEDGYIIAKITSSPSDALMVDRQTVYKENSSITIAVEVNQDFGTRVLKNFQIVDETGTVVAESADGAPVTVLVTGNLKVSNVVTEIIYADFTEMENQLKRLDGADLFDYTDDTRVVAEDRLALAQTMRRVTQKDQQLVDDFVVTLKVAIDALEPKAGDLTKILLLLEKIPQDLSDYTQDTVDALGQAKANAQTAMDEKWNRLRQEEIDALANGLEVAIDALLYKDADYSKVDAAIAKIPTDLSLYTDETTQAVTDAKNAVVRDKDITEQTTVDGYASAIEDAVGALKLKPTEPAPAEPIPNTGDNGMPLLPLQVLMMVSGSALIVMSKKRKSRV